MPKSHICPSCLNELGSIRAVPDEHYALPIVVCPKCSLATVRTRHPDIEFWRGFRRTHWALRNLIAKIALTTIAGLVMFGMTMASGDLFTPGGGLDPTYPFYSGDPFLALGASMVMGASALLMMLVALLYMHRTAFFGVVLFVMVSVFFVTIEYQAIWLEHAMAWIGHYDPDNRLPRTREIVGRMQRFGLLASVSLLGIFPAFLLRGSVNRSDARRFRRLLRKRRKMRSKHD